MLPLQTIAWKDVRFLSLEERKVRVLVQEDVLEFRFPDRESMESELARWIGPALQESYKDQQRR